jgi:hypothetical protein
MLRGKQLGGKIGVLQRVDNQEYRIGTATFPITSSAQNKLLKLFDTVMQQHPRIQKRQQYPVSVPVPSKQTNVRNTQGEKEKEALGGRLGTIVDEAAL